MGFSYRTLDFVGFKQKLRDKKKHIESFTSNYCVYSQKNALKPREYHPFVSVTSQTIINLNLKEHHYTSEVNIIEFIIRKCHTLNIQNFFTYSLNKRYRNNSSITL